MTQTRVRIEYIQNQFPFNVEEFVVVFNGSKEKYDLAGWRLVYENPSTRSILHTHNFSRLNGSFDPGERLCVLSGQGADRFAPAGAEDKFPGPHWDLFTQFPVHIMNLPMVRVQLVDASGALLDAMTVERLRVDPSALSKVTVFIGHGRDPQWRDLKDHLQDHHSISVTAYELGPRAGLSVKEVLEKMLSESSFAILMLTGEDLDAAGEARARENVVHELGLFQGRFGFTRAIALLEDGVREFSNIYGINQIRFPRGRVRETFGDVLATIKRELGLI